MFLSIPLMHLWSCQKVFQQFHVGVLLGGAQRIEEVEVPSYSTAPG